MLISFILNLCCDIWAKFLHKTEYKYSKKDSADQTIPEANARNINWFGTSCIPKLAIQEFFSLTTISTARPIITGGAKSKILLIIELKKAKKSSLLSSLKFR